MPNTNVVERVARAILAADEDNLDLLHLCGEPEKVATEFAEVAVAEYRAVAIAEYRSAISEGTGEQLDRLAEFIMREVPGEPSENEGAGDTAIRVIRTLQARLAEAAEMVRLFPEAFDVLTRQEMRDAKGNWRSLIDQQSAALSKLSAALSPPSGIGE